MPWVNSRSSVSSSVIVRGRGENGPGSDAASNTSGRVRRPAAPKPCTPNRLHKVAMMGVLFTPPVAASRHSSPSKPCFTTSPGNRL